MHLSAPLLILRKIVTRQIMDLGFSGHCFYKPEQISINAKAFKSG